MVLLASLVLAPDALANFITPKSGGSPNANQIDSLYKIVLYIAAVVFVIVEGALVYSVYKFRAKKGAVAAQIHGNTRLEIGWTVAAALILVVLTVVTFVKLPSIVDPPNSDSSGLVLSASLTEPTPPNGKKLTVCVQGRQYIWRYSYGTDCVTAPSPKPAVLLHDDGRPRAHHGRAPHSVHRRDPLVVGAVAGGQGRRRARLHHLHVVQGAPHGQVPRPVRAALRTNHAAMIAYVKVVTPAQYQTWLQRQGQLITAANSQVLQLRQILTQKAT